MYLRFSAALRGFLRHKMTIDQAREIVQQRLAARDETFLKVAGRSIYGSPRSPYLALLRHVGCEFGDLQALVRKGGLEAALETLREQGVYVAFEEFKGRAPISRPGLELPVTPHDFDNPFLVTHFVAESGGSTGVRTRVPHDLDQYASLSPFTMVATCRLWRARCAARGVARDSSRRQRHQQRSLRRLLRPASGAMVLAVQSLRREES